MPAEPSPTLSSAPIGKPERLSRCHPPGRSGPVRKSLQRNAGAIQPNLLRVAIEFDQSFGDRSAPNQDQRHQTKQLLEIGFISALGFPALNVHSVKRNDTRTIPSFDERKQMDAGVSEVDMHEIRIPSDQHPPDDLEFASVN